MTSNEKNPRTSEQQNGQMSARSDNIKHRYPKCVPREKARSKVLSYDSFVDNCEVAIEDHTQLRIFQVLFQEEYFYALETRAGRRVVNFQKDEGERIAPRAKASNVTRVKYPRPTSFQAFSILLFCLPAREKRIKSMGSVAGSWAR